jgi:2-phosphosulfolactate phosphatase
MKFHSVDLETCHTATGLVIVIDVIRAFTNAAVIFSRGAREIYPVGTVEEALEFKRQIPNSLASGEVGGLPPEGFDFGNSPTQTNAFDLNGKIIVQRTGAGTQGAVRCINADRIVAASFVVANATVRYVQSFAPDRITFVITGQVYDGGDEDLACAEYLQDLFCGSSPDPGPFLERVKNSHDAQVFYNPEKPLFLESDIGYCTSLDRFNFAMPITREDGKLVMRCVRP